MGPLHTQQVCLGCFYLLHPTNQLVLITIGGCWWYQGPVARVFRSESNGSWFKFYHLGKRDEGITLQDLIPEIWTSMPCQGYNYSILVIYKFVVIKLWYVWYAVTA